MIDERFPPEPTTHNPISMRILGLAKTPSAWAQIARRAEKANKFGDAYYYWNAGATAYTRSSEKRVVYEGFRDKCLEVWRKDNKSCEEEHTPNSLTKKALEETDKNIDCLWVDSVEELFEELEKDD